jgi:hypothetical protein
LEVVHEFTLHLETGEQSPVGNGPFGTRLVAAVTGGWAKGARISGRLVGPSADWVLVGADGYAQIDVRTQLRTDDGADLYLHYTGSLEMNDAVMSAAADGGETAFDAQYWYTHLRIESGAEQYRWVNRPLFVGHGRKTPDGVEYEIYRLA